MTIMKNSSAPLLTNALKALWRYSRSPCSVLVALSRRVTLPLPCVDFRYLSDPKACTSWDCNAALAAVALTEYLAASPKARLMRK